MRSEMCPRPRWIRLTAGGTIVLAGMTLLAGSAAAQSGAAAGPGPQVGGDVAISVKTGTVTTKGSQAHTCIGSVTSGTVKGNVSIVVNGETKSADNNCSSDSPPPSNPPK